MGITLVEPTHKTLAEWAAAQLRDLILSGQLAPGERLVAHDLAARMGISRTPLREAIHQLEREGLVRVAPNRETIVTAYTAADVREIYQVRAALEGMAASLAARTTGLTEPLNEQLFRMEEVIATNGGRERYADRDLAFHDVILRAANNHRLWEAVWRIRIQTRRYLLLSLRNWSPEGIRPNMDEHIAIAEAIRVGDPRLAEERMRTHITISGERVAFAMDGMRLRKVGSQTGT